MKKRYVVILGIFLIVLSYFSYVYFLYSRDNPYLPMGCYETPDVNFTDSYIQERFNAVNSLLDNETVFRKINNKS